MLARQFDDSKIGTAIWVELVLKRQREIEEAVKNNHVVSPFTEIAARQEISREELAAFDASARSWLASSDEAKLSCQKRMMLIVQNLKVVINGGPSTYAEVVEAWKQALLGFEDLLAGLPQQVSNGAILAALSAWHLYPDLIVLLTKTENVQFEDPLLPKHRVVTVGLQSASPAHKNGIQWSLTLSHLRFYGDPVTVDSDGRNSRVNMKQLHMLAFGSLLRKWKVSSKDTENTAIWFQQLLKTPENTTSKSTVASALPWLVMLANAANAILAAQGEELDTFKLLVDYGRRRGDDFLGKPTAHLRPFFGLGNPYILATLEPDIDHGIRNLREAAALLGLKDREAFIMYTQTCDDGVYHELATAIPHERKSSKRSHDEKMKHEIIHARWIHVERRGGNLKQILLPSLHPPCSCVKSCDSKCACRQDDVFCTEACHQTKHGSCRANWLASRLTKLHGDGEIVNGRGFDQIFAYSDTQDTSLNGIAYIWKNGPALYDNRSTLECSGFSLGQHQCDCLEYSSDIDSYFVRVAGFGEGLSLNISLRRFNDRSFRSQINRFWDSRVDTLSMLRDMCSIKMDRLSLFQFLTLLAGDTLYRKSLLCFRTTYETLLDQGPSLHAVWISLAATSNYHSHDLWSIHRSFVKTFWAISFADRIYDGIITPSIPLKIVEQPLYWNFNYIDTHKFESIPRHAKKFACILTFESGGLRSDPMELETVMAISSRNSILIAGILLNDPAHAYEGPEIVHVVGNVGKPGITLLVSPPRLLIKPPERDFRAVKHVEYDSNRVDNFSSTSLHLSFTKWMQPLNSGEYGLIDQDVFLVEAVISVRDSGRWIADIDVIDARPERCLVTNNCKDVHEVDAALTSIDSWEELLDPPLTTGVVRAHGNWAARLAVFSILKQKGWNDRAVVLSHYDSCPACLADLSKERSKCKGKGRKDHSSNRDSSSDDGSNDDGSDEDDDHEAGFSQDDSNDTIGNEDDNPEDQLVDRKPTIIIDYTGHG